MEESMGLSRRKFTREFKLAALERIERGESLAAVARALEIDPNLPQRWRQEFHASPGRAFPGKGRGRAEPDRVAQLERKIGQQTLEIDFLKGCLQRIEQQRQLQAVLGKPLSTSRSKAREPES
jgi:transposase-like protein